MHDKIVCVRHDYQIKSGVLHFSRKTAYTLRDMPWPDEPYIRFKRFLTSSFSIFQRTSQ